MKTNHITTLVAVASGLAAFSTAGCAETANVAEAPLPPTSEAATGATTASGPGAAVPVAAAANPDVLSAQWIDIKDCTYDMRVQFFTGLTRLEARVDRQISELLAKRATMNGTAETKDWDFTMEAMSSARSYLKSMREEASNATAASWSQKKDKVGQAWAKTQDAYGKVKSSTTS